MKKIEIDSNSKAVGALIAMTHPAGSADFYLRIIKRVSNALLYFQDDLGMSDTETLEILRGLNLLYSDINDIKSDESLANALRSVVQVEHTDMPENSETTLDDEKL